MIWYTLRLFGVCTVRYTIARQYASKKNNGHSPDRNSSEMKFYLNSNSTPYQIKFQRIF